MTVTVGTLQAKTQLSSLIERVAKGEKVVITRRGRPVARLVAATASDDEAAQAVARLKALRRGTTLGGLRWQALRDEGRW